MTHPATDDTKTAPGPADDPITGPVILPQSSDETTPEDDDPEADNDEGS
ncbi:MAG TPA: hypothetical protein VN042_13665 [Asticcacaulis sp.]|jgi:hypothetical protein|nr:hypothetical protein [Asticcacaulis sp.]